MNSEKVTRLWPQFFIVRSPAKNDYFNINKVLLDEYDQKHRELWYLFQKVNHCFWSLPASIRDIDYVGKTYATSLYIIELFILLDLNNVYYDVEMIYKTRGDEIYVLINCLFLHNIKLQLTCKSDTYDYSDAFHNLLFLNVTYPTVN